MKHSTVTVIRKTDLDLFHLFHETNPSHHEVNTETSFHHYHIFRFLAFWKCNAGCNLINKTALLENKREFKENSSVLQNSGRKGDWIKKFFGTLVAWCSRIYVSFLKILKWKICFWFTWRRRRVKLHLIIFSIIQKNCFLPK